MTGGRIDGLPIDRLLEDRLLDPRSVAEVVERHGVPGTLDPARVFASRVLGGFDADFIASRGLDVGRVAWRGVPVSWNSPVQDHRALDRPRGDDWLERFTGGLVTTCGPFHIGASDGEHGLHGDFSHRPASDVAVHREGGAVRVTGTIQVRSLFGPSVDVHRTIVSQALADGARLRITDDVANVGTAETPIMMLYHCNIGAPFAVPGATVDIRRATTTAREPEHHRLDARVLPSPSPGAPEIVFAHHGVAVDDSGWSCATITRPGSGLSLEIAWSAASLPQVHQWVLPRPDAWALAIEPSSAPLFPPPTHPVGLPVLPPGTIRRHEIMVTIREASTGCK